VYLRYQQLAVVEGTPWLGDLEIGTVASLTLSAVACLVVCHVPSRLRLAVSSGDLPRR